MTPQPPNTTTSGEARVYVVVNGSPQGPMNIEQLRGEMNDRRVSLASLGWMEGRTAWLLALMALTICGCSTAPKEPLQNATQYPFFSPDSKSKTEAAAAEAEQARARARAMERALQAAAAANQKMESESKKLGALDYFRLGQPKLMAIIRTLKQEIGAVDTTGCPQEFRDAYLDFTHRLNDGFDAMDPYLGWRGQKMGLLKPWKIFEIEEKTDEAMRPVGAAWQKLERIAVAGGATIPK